MSIDCVDDFESGDLPSLCFLRMLCAKGVLHDGLHGRRDQT